MNTRILKRVERGFKGHFICADRCQYSRCTDLGTKWRVSTVGDFYVQRDRTTPAVRETVGCDRFYETMVFPLGKRRCECGCGARKVSDFSELDFEGYQKAGEADKGHEAMVRKWAKTTTLKREAQ